MLLNPRGFCKGRKFNLATDHWSLKNLFLTHMLSKSDLPQLFRKLTMKCTFLPNPKFCNKISKELCYQTREGFAKFFQDFKFSTHPYLLPLFPNYYNPPIYCPSFYHLLRTTHSSPPKRLWEQVLSRFELKIMSGKKRT